MFKNTLYIFKIVRITEACLNLVFGKSSRGFSVMLKIDYAGLGPYEIITNVTSFVWIK